ncbi:MAG: peptidoglycan editing factor PgeF [Candidatus Omnitrophica bacterium]|nr:peptidoglycan editing factor PgeF [Candidatus Omnitrophota bacterium]MBI5023829.1 peptidoglycan editing factor PgeF [Candidatus Omnitrophota bacterium]
MPSAKLLTTTQPFHDFFPPHVVTFISDRSADFKFSETPTPFTRSQSAFLAQQLGFRLPEVLTIRQVHGNKIIIALRSAARRAVSLEDADGILTDRRDLAIAVRTADCLSVFLYDPRNEAIGLFHAGWRGTQQQISARAVALMRKQWDSNPKDLRVAFGPAIRSCCYRVGASFLEHFPKETLKRKEGYFFDLPEANKKQLAGAGVVAANIADCSVCTCCDVTCFSYRRERESAGRMISIMMLKK